MVIFAVVSVIGFIAYFCWRRINERGTAKDLEVMNEMMKPTAPIGIDSNSNVENRGRAATATAASHASSDDGIIMMIDTDMGPSPSTDANLDDIKLKPNYEEIMAQTPGLEMQDDEGDGLPVLKLNGPMMSEDLEDMYGKHNNRYSTAGGPDPDRLAARRWSGCDRGGLHR